MLGGVSVRVSQSEDPRRNVIRIHTKLARMRTVIIGATGHIGTWLVPRLVNEGHDVVAVSRGERRPYHDSAEWQSVEHVTPDLLRSRLGHAPRECSPRPGGSIRALRHVVGARSSTRAAVRRDGTP
ncbi:MAG: NAD-dependent epimerase/dehydratase family protein [Gemmatimonadales bacterium]